MEKDKNIRINRLTNPAPEYRLDELRSLLEFHDLPVVMQAMLKYMPESSFRMMVEDLRMTERFMIEQQAIFEEGGLPGQGALKALVGKSSDNQLDSSECAKIGRIIAAMKSYPRQYYVGMMNFLGASCRIHREISSAYSEEVRRLSKDGEESAEAVPDIVNRMFPGKAQPSKEEIKQREKEEIERLEKLNKSTMDKIQGEKEERKQSRAEEFARTEMEKRGIQPQEEQPQEEPQPEQPKKEQPQEEQPQEEPQPEQPKVEPKPKKKEKKKSEPRPKFKQYIPQLSVSKGFTRPNINRTMRK